MKDYFVYILTNKPRGTLYVGVTNDLVRRTYEHREGVVPGFTKRYGLKQLVYFEKYDVPTLAIQREKSTKHWSRAWKLDLINSSNPQWRDLYTDITRGEASWMRGSSPRMTLRGCSGNQTQSARQGSP
jgi:putative endonuclease